MGYTHYWTHTKVKPTVDNVATFRDTFRRMLEIMPNTVEKQVTSTDIMFNGIGDLSHEDCLIDFTGQGNWTFCKTARKPYDTIVVACLILAKDLGIIEEWSSDGDDSEGDFDAGRELLEKAKQPA